MLADSLVEEFEIREDEPWYDQQDLQQGEPGRGACDGGCVRAAAVGKRRGLRAGAALGGACQARGCGEARGV